MFPLLSSIPDPIKQKITDSLVGFLADQAKKLGSDQVSDQISKLFSHTDFSKQVDKAIKSGIERFAAEYVTRDEELAGALQADTNFWQSEKVQQELLALIKRPGTWMPQEKEQVIGHFSDILPKRIQRERVDDAVTYFLHCIVEELWTVPEAKEIREVYALQFQKISAEAAKEQVVLTRQQLKVLTQLNGELPPAIMQLTAAIKNDLLITPRISVFTETQRKPFQNLQRPDYNIFVGRKTELDWLRKRLHPMDRSCVVAITGISGVGKSALALAIAHEYRKNYEGFPPGERYEAIIWISAKEEVLTMQGKEPTAPSEMVIHTLEDVYIAIANILDREDITRALPEEQSSVVQNALKAQRTLLIIDNLESIRDKRIKPFLRGLPDSTKALITSREWLETPDVLVLKGLNLSETKKLIHNEMGTMNVRFDNFQTKRLFELTFGLPLPIKIAISRYYIGEAFPVIERWLIDATGDLSDYCIHGQAELAKRRNPDAWKLILVFSLIERTSGATLSALRDISDLSEIDRDKCLGELLRLFLIMPVKEERYTVLPIVQRYVSHQLSLYDKRELVIESWLNWLERYVQSKGNRFRLDKSEVDYYDSECQNILLGVRWCLDHELWERLFKLFQGFWGYMYIKGYYQQAENIIDHLFLGIPSKDIVKLPWINLQLGRILWVKGSYKEAKGVFEKTRLLALQAKDSLILGETLVYQATICYREGDLQGSEAYSREFIDLSNQIPESKDKLRLEINTFIRLASIMQVKKNFNSALSWLDEADQLISTKSDLEFEAIAVEYRRAQIMMDLQDYDEAETLILDNLRRNLDIGDKRHIADDKKILAELYLKKHDLRLSQKAAIEALEIFRELNMKFDAQKIKDFLDIHFKDVSFSSKL